MQEFNNRCWNRKKAKSMKKMVKKSSKIIK